MIVPTYLESPGYQPGGPDGQGWNRLSLNAHMGAERPQCALRPTGYVQVFDLSRAGTLHARWGGHGVCDSGEPGACLTCPRLTAKPQTLDTDVDRIAIRIVESSREVGTIGVAYTSRLEQDAVPGWRPTWADVWRADGWRVGRRFRDERGEGFWLVGKGAGREAGV